MNGIKPHWNSSHHFMRRTLRSQGADVGYIKAQSPQDDVSFAVHSDTTIAINGFFVKPEMLGKGVGRMLLAALADASARLRYSMISVDYETSNLEAYSFWTRWFRPVAFSFEH